MFKKITFWNMTLAMLSGFLLGATIALSTAQPQQIKHLIEIII